MLKTDLTDATIAAAMAMDMTEPNPPALSLPWEKFVAADLANCLRVLTAAGFDRPRDLIDWLTNTIEELHQYNLEQDRQDTFNPAIEHLEVHAAALYLAADQLNPGGDAFQTYKDLVARGFARIRAMDPGDRNELLDSVEDALSAALDALEPDDATPPREPQLPPLPPRQTSHIGHFEMLDL